MLFFCFGFQNFTKVITGFHCFGGIHVVSKTSISLVWNFPFRDRAKFIGGMGPVEKTIGRKLVLLL